MKVPMGVSEEADIEHHIGIARQSPAIGKRGHEDPELGRVFETEPARQDAPQVVDRDIGRVDDDIGRMLQRFENRAFVVNAVQNGAIERQRVPAAGFGEPPQKESSSASTQSVEPPRPAAPATRRAGPAAPPPRSPGSGCRFRWRAGGRATRPAPAAVEQEQRQIIDRLVPQILERLERRREAGAGHAGDQDETPRLLGGLGDTGVIATDAAVRRPPAWRNAVSPGRRVQKAVIANRVVRCPSNRTAPVPGFARSRLCPSDRQRAPVRFRRQPPPA